MRTEPCTISRMNGDPHAARKIGIQGRQNGFTLVEIMVVLGLITVLAGIAAAAFGGRARIVLLDAHAEQAAEALRARQIDYAGGVRAHPMSTIEIAAAIDQALAPGSNIVTSVAAETGACADHAAMTSPTGLRIFIASGALSHSEAQRLQDEMRARIAEVFDGIGPDDLGGYRNVLEIQVADNINDAASNAHTAATAGHARRAHLCFGD